MAISMQNDTDLLKQMAIKKQNKCKSFEWFDRHVLYKLVGRHHPWKDLLDEPFEDTSQKISCGQHQANKIQIL